MSRARDNANTSIFGTPSVTLGEDATGDVYYRAAGGALTRLATGADGTVLTSTGTAAVPAFEAIPAGGVDGITSSANANAIAIDASEQVVLKAQPMLGLIMDASGNQTITTSFATITKLSDTQTGCFKRGITHASGVVTIILAGKYLITGFAFISSHDSGDIFKLQYDFSSNSDKKKEVTNATGGVITSIGMSGVFDLAASETVTFKIKSNPASGLLEGGPLGTHFSMVYLGE